MTQVTQPIEITKTMATKTPYERKIQVGIPPETEYLGYLNNTGHQIYECARRVDPELTRDVREVIHSCCDKIEDLLKDHQTKLDPMIDMMPGMLDAFQNALDLSFLMEAMKYSSIDSHNCLVADDTDTRPTLKKSSKAARERVGSAFTEKD